MNIERRAASGHCGRPELLSSGLRGAPRRLFFLYSIAVPAGVREPQTPRLPGEHRPGDRNCGDPAVERRAAAGAEFQEAVHSGRCTVHGVAYYKMQCLRVFALPMSSSVVTAP